MQALSWNTVSSHRIMKKKRTSEQCERRTAKNWNPMATQAWSRSCTRLPLPVTCFVLGQLTASLSIVLGRQWRAINVSLQHLDLGRSSDHPPLGACDRDSSTPFHSVFVPPLLPSACSDLSQPEVPSFRRNRRAQAPIKRLMRRYGDWRIYKNKYGDEEDLYLRLTDSNLPTRHCNPTYPRHYHHPNYHGVPPF